MKVTLYLGSSPGKSVNAKQIRYSNPGIGGTQYCILLLADYLANLKGYEITLLSVRNYDVDGNIKFISVSGDDEVCNKATVIGTDILILPHFPNSEILKRAISTSSLKVIVWSHNFINSSFCKYISQTPQIKCNVFVSKQQYDAYIDDNIISKCRWIFNMVPQQYKSYPKTNRKNQVVFVGAICRKKGFLEMCKIWPGIVKEVPDAELIVLGNGSLYREIELGEYGIADEKYEKKFIPYITDEKGNILSSIKFIGLVGSEKNKFFDCSKVGIVNPSGCRETFGMAIIEMGTHGLPVVTKGTTGYYDTVKTDSGFLEKNLRGIQKQIVRLLKNKALEEDASKNAFTNSQRFSPDIIGPQWEELLSEVYNDKVINHVQSPSQPYWDNFKIIRIVIKKIRRIVKFFPSSVQIEDLIISFMKKL